MDNNSLVHQQTPQYQSDPDEINLLEYAYALVKSKWFIIIPTFLGLLLGFGVAMKKGPQYVAEVTIAPRESDNQKTPNLSALGGFSSLLAGQVSLMGNASLDKIDQILSSRSFGAALLNHYDMLPFYYKYAQPKTFTTVFDTTTNKFKPDFKKPDSLILGGALKGYITKKVTNNTMLITITSKDSTLTDTLMARYLEYLDIYIKERVANEANANVEFLEQKVLSVTDPLLREKVQNMIANELEKAMVVSKEAFKILDPPFRSKKFKEKKLYPMVFGAGLFFMSMLWVIFAHAFSSAQKTDEDKKLIEGIKKELFKI